VASKYTYSSPELKVRLHNGVISSSGQSLKISSGAFKIPISVSNILRLRTISFILVTGSAELKVKSNEGISFLHSSAYLHIINLVPDYLTTLDECNNISGAIPELKIPVKVGELVKIIEFEEEIEKIYNKPFSIYFDKNTIYGRLIKIAPITMRVYFKSGKVMKLTLIPYKSELVKFVFG
jgi:hypothetical protein